MPVNVPRISLGTATLNPAVFQGTAFTPQKEDMSLLQHSIDKLDERKEKTDQQRAIIAKALGEVQLNEADNEWKQQYIDSIKARIDSASQFGDYSAALETATKLAGEAIVDPELQSRAKENENYQNWKKEVESLYLNNKINKDTRDYFLDTTKYKFTGDYRPDGSFKTYSPTEYAMPMQSVELSSLFSWVGQTVAEQSGSSQGVGARTATGGTTEYYSPDASILTHGGNAWSKKEYDTIKQVWDEAIKRHPEAVRYLQQQMDVNEWLLQKVDSQLEDENLTVAERENLLAEQKRLRNDLYVDGDISKPYTTQEYLIASSDKTLRAMAYNRQNSTFNVASGGSGLGRGAGYGQGGGFSSLNFSPTQAGPSGLIDNAVMKHLNSTLRVGSGNDISNALNRTKK